MFEIKQQKGYTGIFKNTYKNKTQERLGKRDKENNQNKYISRVPDQNGVSLLYIMLEIHHSGWEPSIYQKQEANDS